MEGLIFLGVVYAFYRFILKDKLNKKLEFDTERIEKGRSFIFVSSITAVIVYYVLFR